MLRDLAGAYVSPVDQERLRLSCHSDQAFPPTYEEWLQLVARGDAQAEQSGWPRDRINVDVDEFARWCSTAEVRPCVPAMQAFVIMKRRGLQQALEGDL